VNLSFALPRWLSRRVRFPLEARIAKTVHFGLPLLSVVVDHLPDDAGCFVHGRFHFGTLRFEHACFCKLGQLIFSSLVLLGPADAWSFRRALEACLAHAWPADSARVGHGAV